MSWIVRLIVLLPALAGLAGLLARRAPTAARVIAVGTAVVVTVLGLVEWLAPANRTDIDTVGTLPLDDLGVPLNLLSDRLSGLVAFVVALVVLAIQIYSVWYLRDDRRYTQFAATVSLFAAGMLLVVHSSDLVLTLVGWEVMGWCSWLLIGHDTERAAARRAAYKAFMVTAVADIGMVVGLIALSVRAGSTDLVTVLTTPGSVPLLTFGLVCVAIGVAGKSGLMPFQDWLPDAMEGPTPASALIHAATMVAAGSYVVARLFVLYAQDDAARVFLAVLASLTMVYAAALAFAQTDLKRLLAYSTLSQVAIMLGAVVAASPELGPVGAMGHLIGHAFFKALLFLGAGWLAALFGSTAIAAMRGRLRPTGALRLAMGLGLAALAGVPPMIGFFTKDTVLDAALSGTGAGGGAASWLVVIALFVTIALTAAYCVRAWLLLDRPAKDGPETAQHPAASGHAHAPITLPAALSVAALAVLSVGGTLLLLSLDGALHVGVLLALISTLIVLGIGYAGWSVSDGGARDLADRLPTRVRDGAVAGFGADRAYAAVGRSVLWLARGVVALDRDVVDAYPRAAVVATRHSGQLGERAHRGIPSSAALGVLVGVVLIVTVGVIAWL